MCFQAAIGFPREEQVSPESSTPRKVICGRKSETKVQAIAFAQKEPHPNAMNLHAWLFDVETNWASPDHCSLLNQELKEPHLGPC